MRPSYGKCSRKSIWELKKVSEKVLFYVNPYYSMDKNLNDYIWYVAYGSNLLCDRFMWYIKGGQSPYREKPYTGCNDKNPPSDNKKFIVPYPLYYGNESSSREWSGVAFIDANQKDVDITLGRAYLITKEQFEQVWEQETTTKEKSEKWYGRRVSLGIDKNWIEFATFTSKTRRPENEPNEKYKKVIGEGRAETENLELIQAV